MRLGPTQHLALLIAPIAARAQAQDAPAVPAAPSDSVSAAVQDSIRKAHAWKFGTVIGVNLSQSSFSDNWKGGDRGSFVWVANSDLTLERQFTRRFNLSNKLQAAYGQTAQQVPDPKDPRARVWDTPQKSTDLLALETVGRFTLDKFLDPFFSFRGETQFVDESSPIGKIRFNPITLKETAGVARVFEKTEDREAISRVGFGFRQTIATSFTDPIAKTKESFTAQDGGIDWQTTVTRPILKKRILYKGSLGVFKPVFYSKSDDLKAFDALADSAAAANGTTHGAIGDYWKAVDVNVQSTWTAQITKLLSVNLFAQWVYDKFDAAANVNLAQPFDVLSAELDRNTRKRGQFKETLAIGLTYRLF